MKVEMTMPDLSTASSNVKILNWLVTTGQSVQRGQALLEIETDKASMEVESYLSGILSEVLAPAETEVEVGQVIAIIETQDEAIPTVQSEPAACQPSIPMPTPVAPAAPPTESKPGGMFARNRQKAAQPQAEVKLTSPQGFLEQNSPDSRSSWSTNQRVVALRMQESKQTIPHFYLQSSANAEAMLAMRNAVPGEKPVWDAFFVYAVGQALKIFERMSACIQDGQLVSQEAIDSVGVAVDLERDLYVIQIASPASKTPEQISVEIRTLVKRLQAGDPEVRKARPSNMTISNLGAAGVESFIAIVNPPEAAILAIGKVAPAVVAIDGQVAIQQRVSLTLSVDHRIVSGRYAADFLAKIVEELEHPGANRH